MFSFVTSKRNGSSRALRTVGTKSLISVALLILLCVALASYGTEFDSGPIESVSNNVVLVRGNKGIYELELIGPCLWCEEGLEVLITFSGILRATLTPHVKSPDSFSPRPVHVLITRDARYEE
ncbi:hypothetical protein [Desulfomonile tiedjei]|uniref:Uncharacterized protein n=1 Tax=Desulfomonile tiedjei (strain ATCC 49306 / DSM 6799 / DCB-1) TaxID=706587 RepID=I4C276_DESTA|nr:hypothetical protein [Desulfomonile tiedjei]AFM23667.1 hypothetical protein Desti_0948 [Desulfomonile tiedjei DSM 6799]